LNNNNNHWTEYKNGLSTMW